MKRNRRPFTGIAVLALCAACACVASAVAQDNSMLHAQRRHVSPGAPTSQPANPGAGLGLAAGIRVHPLQPGADPTEDPPMNPTLLTVSPFAVAAPKQKKFQVNDLVTIIIRESQTSLNDAKSTLEKDWQLKSELAKWFRLNGRQQLAQEDLSVNGSPGVDWTFNNKYDTKGNYDRKDELTTRITAVIIDVKPNGNLVLQASKLVTHSGGDVLSATLTGICRAGDVTAQNTVLSTQIADLKIDMSNTGAVRDATRRGWIMRLFDFARPI